MGEQCLWSNIALAWQVTTYSLSNLPNKNASSGARKSTAAIYLWSSSLSLSLSLCEQTEGGVLAVSCQTQAVSTITQLMIFNSKIVWFTKTKHPDTNSSPYKNQRDTRSRLPWHETSLLLHSTSCITEHLRKGRQKWDIWRMFEETSEAANVSILELCAGVGAEHTEVHSTHPKCKLQSVHTNTDKAVTMLLFWPWPHQLRQMFISVPSWHVSTRRQWLFCCAENVSSFLSHSPWPSTWAVQCDGRRKWRGSRTCQPAPQKATSINGQTSEEAVNPFEDDGGCLFSLDSKVIVDAAAMTTVSSVITSGIQQYSNFVEERLQKRTNITTLLRKGSKREQNQSKSLCERTRCMCLCNNGRLRNLPWQSSAMAARCFRGFTLHMPGEGTCQNFSGTKTSHHHRHSANWMICG